MSNTTQHPQQEENLFEPSSSSLRERETAVSPQVDTITILSQLAETMLNLFEVTSVYIINWQPQTGVATVIAESFSSQANDQEKVSDLGIPYNLYELEGSLVWLEEKKTYYYHYDNPNYSAWEMEHMQQYGCKTALIVPLVMDDYVFGFAEIWESRRKREYDEKELKLAQQIAQQATLTLLNAQLYQAEAQRRRESELVQEITGYLASTLNIDELLIRVLDTLRSYLTNIQSCSISVLEQNGRFLRTQKSWANKKEHIIFPDGTGLEVDKTFIARRVIAQKEAVFINDLRQIEASNKQLQVSIDQGLRSLLYVPLLVKDAPIGILHINIWDTPRQFTKEEVNLTQTVANQAAIAIENAHLFTAQRQQLKLSQTLQQVGSLLTSSMPIEAVYERIFDLLAEVITFVSVSIQLLDEKTNHFALGASRGFKDVEILKQIIAKNSDHILHKIPMPPGWRVIPNTYENNDWIYEPEGSYIHAWIGAGMFIKGKLIGVLNVDSDIPYAYNDEMGKTIATFANQAAIAIENARLYEKTRTQAEEVAILHLLAQTTAVTLDVDKLLQQTTDLIVQKIYPDIFGFLLFNEETNSYRTHTSVHGIDPKWHNYDLAIDKSSIIGLVALTGEPYLTNDVKNDPLYMQIDSDTQSEIAIPINLNNKVIGIINVESPHKNAFSQKDFNFLTTLSVNVAAAIERAQLYKSLQNQANALSEEVAAQTAKLEAEGKRTSAILASAGEGIVLTDTNTIILYANDAMERQTGYSRQELIGKTPKLLSSGANSDKLYSDMWKTISKQDRWTGELRNKRKDGSFYDIAITISSLVDEAGQIDGYVSVHSDISRLKEVDRLKTEFIANVSHELRTPLTNIKMYISLIERGKPENFPRYFKVLHQETDRLGRLIQGLLDISRVETSLAPDPDICLEIRPYLQQIIHEWAEKAAEKQIHIHLDWQTEAPLFVCVEKAHFVTIINNLIENAIYFSPPDSKITLTAHPVTLSQQSFISIHIQDHGFGIPQNEQAKIYDRFFRGNIAYERNISGAGLGLAIVKETIDSYNGRIHLSSNEEQGSTFTIWLPTPQS